jgi:hypothetical protein
MSVTQPTPDSNPYAPPQARVADSASPRIKPRHVRWAVIALWVAYGLTFTHAAIIIGDRWMSWPPEYVVLNQLAFELLYVVLIYFVSRGQIWARLLYACLLVPRTLNVARNLPEDWRSSHALVLMTMASFACQYIAVYWLFSATGRRWFARSAAD